MTAATTPPRILWRGIDTLKTGYYCDGTDPVWQAVSIHKLKYRESGIQATYNDTNIYVCPAARGKYNASLENRGNVYMIRKDPYRSRDESPHVMVESHPMAIAARGLQQTREDIENDLKAVRLLPVGNVVSEVHLTCDIEHQLRWGDIWQLERDETGRPLEIDGQPVIAPRFTSRVRTGRNIMQGDPDDSKIFEYIRGRHYETFQLGKNNLVRIYDKCRELKARPQKMWETHLWGEHKDCKTVTRVEFQLRREMLKQLDINTLDDLQSRIGEIWAYLTQMWFRLDTPWWAAVQSAFKAPKAAERIRPNKDGCKKSAMAQFVGQMHRAMLIYNIDDPILMLRTAQAKYQNAKGKSWHYIYAQKKAYHETQFNYSDDWKIQEAIDFLAIGTVSEGDTSPICQEIITGGDVIHIPAEHRGPAGPYGQLGRAAIDPGGGP